MSSILGSTDANAFAQNSYFRSLTRTPIDAELGTGRPQYEYAITYSYGGEDHVITDKYLDILVVRFTRWLGSKEKGFVP